ncbi:MAG TPA: B-box zinc finger protein, partial [Verrucomicrobiae bacterium]|nr:B-box zinc finger protein [Verrucomicrobiae bacterium]
MKYALDIGAENLNNPIRFACNQCGVDNSTALNQIVRQQYGTVQEATTPICHRHSDQPATANCLMCKKPICPQCMALFGYVCSAYCAGQAERAGVTLPAYEGQRDVVEARFWKKVRGVVYAALALLAVLAGVALWYNFSGSRPKPVYALKLPQKRDEGFCKFITSEEILVQHGNKLARLNIKQKRELWSTHLIDPEQIKEAAAAWVDAEQFHAENFKLRMARLQAEGRKKEAELLMSYDREPKSEAEQLAEAADMIEEQLLRRVRFHVQNSDIWIGYTNKIAHVDWASGVLDKEIPLTGDLRRFIARDGALLALCEKPLGDRAVTYVRLPAGEAQTDEIKLELAQSTNATRMRLPDVDIPVTAMTVHIRPNFLDDSTDRFMATAVGTYIVNAGTNVAQMDVSMIEKKIGEQRTMKPRTGKSVLDGDVNPTKSTALANEILNEIQEQRTGGVRFEDESRYLVRIKRKLATGSIPDWVREVSGPPQLFTLNTVDVLTAGKMMIVIDKNNQTRWETKLTYPASSAMMMGGRAPWNRGFWEMPMPCMERGSILYFFDQGVLAAFEIATGNARWRLPTVGVSELKFDSEGMMYVVTTSAQQEQIK